ncbi:MAG: hypothetical protein Rubg2KO_30360 [Rubricoccaceae bacterium]
MDPDSSSADWTRLKDLFGQALELAPDERAAFLDEVCRQPDGTPDVTLRAAVQELLDADAEETGFLGNEDAEAFMPILGEAAAKEQEGRRIGPYELVERVGEGGMGEVFRAERADGAFEQTVALKLVKRGMDTDAVLRRFEAERAILARLDHPGIARLLGGGVTDDGRPWFAMEYVEGEPITAASAALGLAERLALFDGVCAAVQHAHARLVVHRDLKPSNVLVVDREDTSSSSGTTGLEPNIKLLDFGIAKLLDSPGGDASVLTVTGVRPMTRPYAAPEQVRGEPITVATDVYALGVVLYELLTGRRPFLATTIAEIERDVLETDPTAPSTALRGEQNDASPVTARQLVGDLDVICLKALRKEPEARYATVEALREDLRRYREGLPVTAQAPTVGYRARRFVQRHRAGVLTTVGVVALLMAGTVLYTTRVQAERDLAETEAAKAQQTAQVLLNLFDRDPLSGEDARSDTLTLRAFLEESESAIEGELDGQPEVESEVLALLARLYLSLGRYDRAEPLAERSLALRQALPDVSPSVLADGHSIVGIVRWKQGDYDGAEEQFQHALAGLRSAPGSGPPLELAAVLDQLASVYNDRGRGSDYDDALQLDVESLELRRQELGDDHLTVAAAHNGLAVAYYNLDRTEEGIDHAQRALEIRRDQLGDHPLVANTLNNLAVFVEEVGDMDEAVGYYRDALRIWIGAHGARHPDASPIYSNLSDTLGKLGRLQEAAAMRDSALVIDRATLPPDHPFLARGLVQKGRLQMRLGENEAAVASFRESVGIYQGRTDLPPNELLVAEAELGLALASVGNRSEARTRLRQAAEALGDTSDEFGTLPARVRDALASL